jgi:hypothetical protein
MRIAGVKDPDAGRPAKEVAAERGLQTNLFQGPRFGETWADYCLRTGEARRDTARAWWQLNQDLDAARGLPRDEAPDWANPAAIAQWEDVPWLTEGERTSLRAGALPLGPLHERLEPWNRFEAAVQEIVRPEATSIAELVERQATFEQVVAAARPPIELAAEALLPRPQTIGKWLKKGGTLILDGTVVAVRLGTKVVPLMRTAKNIYDVAKFLDSLVPHVDSKYLPTREYQIGSPQQWIWRWPAGEVTAAPPP